MTLADLGMGPTAGNDTCPPEAHLPRWLSTGDLTFMAAATNAVTAANNVNTQLNSVALELQSSVDNVRTIIDDATLVARTDSHLDVAQVSKPCASSLVLDCYTRSWIPAYIKSLEAGLS